MTYVIVMIKFMRRFNRLFAAVPALLRLGYKPLGCGGQVRRFNPAKTTDCIPLISLVRRWCGGSGVYPPIPPYRSYAPIGGWGRRPSGWTELYNMVQIRHPSVTLRHLGEQIAPMRGARTQMALTKHKKRTDDGVAPLTHAEITILTVQFPPDKMLRLGSGDDIRREMRRIYRGVIDGRLPLAAGTKLVYILDKIAKSATEDEKLEILRKGGISGAPFVGLMIVPPK